MGDTLKDAGECGAPMTGIALCLSPGRGTLEVRNIAVQEILNLGTMEANGMRQYPTAITLLLKDAHPFHRDSDGLTGPSGEAGWG